MNCERNSSGVSLSICSKSMLDIKRYRSFLSQFVFANCSMLRMWGVARAKLPTLLSDGGGNWNVCADFIKTVWRLT
jgi:hypothetical protein